MTKVRPVILCGGAGTRLWPVSRAQFPKQFARFDAPLSLLQRTAQRVRGPLFAPPLLVTAEEQRFLVRDQLDDIGVEAEALILEQQGRNTAPAIAIAAEWLRRTGEDELMLVLPSDHLIRDEPAFVRCIEQAVVAAGDERLVTFAITPTRAETGYGYLRIAPEEKDSAAYVAVREFVEKPSPALAEQYLASGEHYWNGGIFLFRASAFLEELKVHAPEVAAWAAAATASGSEDGLFFRPQERNEAPVTPSISVDYAVMERSSRVAAVLADMGWSDLGSWEEVWQQSSHDGAGNACLGHAVAVDTGNSLIFADDDMTVATVGVEDVVVVATKDSVLVAARDKAQDVRKVHDALKRRGLANGDVPCVVHRPWGTYETTDRDERFQTKRIVVKPGAKLSTQLHHHRSEHWIVVAGTAEVTVGDKTFMLYENQSTYISAGTVHRLANPGKVPLHLVEVQCGTYLGEDDIVRFDDIYGRVPAS